MRIDIASVVSVVIVLSLLLCESTSATQGSAGSQSPGAHEQCRTVTQYIPKEYMEGTKALYNTSDRMKMKICGAWPACSSCYEMEQGDCRYVFPTNVMVYTKKHLGKEQICACQVLTCSLPWDPAILSRKCTAPIACYNKPSTLDTAEFPESLSIRPRKGLRIKFGPMSFAYQNYLNPGVAMLVYEGEKLIEKKYIFDVQPRSYSNNSDDEEVVKSLKEARRAWREGNTKLQQAGLQGASSTSNHATQCEGDGAIVIDVVKSRRCLKLYRKYDSVCVKYFGVDSEAKAKSDACYPIPSPFSPILYAQGGYVRGGYTGKTMRSYIDRRSKSQPSLTSQYGSESDEEKVLTQKILMGYNSWSNAAPKLKNEEQEELVDIVESNRYGSNVSCEIEKNTDVSLHSDQTNSIAIDTDRGINKFSGYIMRGFAGRKNFRSALYFAGIFYSFIKTSCRFASKHLHSTNASQYSDCEYRTEKVRSEGEVSDHAKGITLCPHGVLDDDKEYEVLIKVHCGTEDYCEHSTRSVQELGSENNLIRVRVKKKPKTLRRYAVVNNGGVDRRVRCDDRYAIDPYTVSQDVLNESDVASNKFIFPVKYLEGSLSDTSDDPCRSNKSRIEYYYESGGFVAGDHVLENCGNPIEEHYAPGKKVVGCEYDYVRADNYKPFLQGLSRSISHVPMSKYEQGLCVDNFEKTWFRPDYRVGVYPVQDTRSANQEAQCCSEWKRDETKNVLEFYDQYGQKGYLLNDSQQQIFVRSKYQYPIPTRQDTCTLYRVEMWGGGEAARRTIEGGKRSGRPGQYVMLVLDFAKRKRFNYTEKSSTTYLVKGIEGEDACVLSSNGEESQVLPWKCIVARVNNSSELVLVLTVGEGGSNEISHGKGNDTTLHLCKSGNGRDHSKWPYTDKKVVVRREKGNSSGDNSLKQKYENWDGVDCYEIARAVGGGSEKIVEPKYDVTHGLMVYYRTIYGDVLDGDESSKGLLEKGNAMFAKFSLEMNLRKYNDKSLDKRIDSIVSNQRYFEGRSLPRQFCRSKKYRFSERTRDDVLIPGAGGCWSQESGDNAQASFPGVGENGAVMITCERWGGGRIEQTNPNPAATKRAKVPARKK